MIQPTTKWPLVFIPYLALSGQWRAARNATLTFLVATAAMFAVAPGASWAYFTKDTFDISRVGNSVGLGSQTFHAAIVRAHLAVPSAIRDLVVVGVLCGGIARAAMAHRRSSAMLGCMCGHRASRLTHLMAAPLRVDRARPHLAGGGY